jgi:hypothetical protein
VELLKAVAAQRIAAGQDELPLDVAATQEPMALEIVSSRMGRLLDAIAAVYRRLGFDNACGNDAVFEQLVTARIIEPTSKQDASRVLAEAGVRALSYRTVKRRLPGYAKPEWRDRLSGACAAAAQLGPSALILYDVTTLWFETDTGHGFREPGFSKERRLGPQITVGLLTDATVLSGTRYAMMAAPLTCPRRTPSRDAVSALQASMGSVSTLSSCTGATSSTSWHSGSCTESYG